MVDRNLRLYAHECGFELVFEPFLELGLAPVTLVARVAHAKAFTLGRTAQETEPDSPAAREVADLYRWAMERL